MVSCSVLCGVLSWLLVVVVMMVVVVVVEVEEEARTGDRRLVGSCRLGPWALGLVPWGRVAEDKRWEEVLDDCVSYGVYGATREAHANHASGRTRRLPGAPRFDGVL